MSSLERGIELLAALEKADCPLSLSELARATDIHKATVQRLLAVLHQHGFVQKVHGRYQIGATVLSLARAFLGENDLSKAGRPILDQLAFASGETSSIFVRQGHDRVVVQRVDSSHTLRYSLQIGQRLPLHLGASGRVLAAAMPEEELNDLLEQVGDVRLPNGDLLTRQELEHRIIEARQNGFSVSFEERVKDVVSVAAPVIAQGLGTIAALAVAGPASRITRDRIPSLIEETRRAASELGRVYGRM